MQLSGLIDKLQGFVSKAVFISAVLPLICLALVNGALLATLLPSDAAGIRDALLSTPAKATFSSVLAVPALLCAAYVFSSFNLLLRQVLEGKYLPWPVRPLLQRQEVNRLGQRMDTLNTCRDTAHRLRHNADVWIETLGEARNKGSRTNQCNYSGKEMNKLLAGLEALRRRAGPVSVDECERLSAAVKTLAPILGQHDAEFDNPDGRLLDRHQIQLVDLIEHAVARAKQAYIDAYNYKEFNFSRYTVAATRMGNIAESIRSYAQSRYDINLDFIWTRLQNTFQQNSIFYGSVQDAKIQLDLMVSSFWLSAGTTGLWIVLLPFVATTWTPVIGVWGLGVSLTVFWYQAAVQAYLSFADLLRSSVDLFRLDLLKTLKVPGPTNSEEERRIWDTLNQKLCYGDDVLICYE